MVDRLVFDSTKVELAKIDEHIRKIEEINRDYSNSLIFTDSNQSPNHRLKDALINHAEKIEQLVLTSLLKNVIDQYLYTKSLLFKNIVV